MNGISQLGGYGGQQLAPQGFFGGLLGAPLGGMIGRGLGGMFGNAALGGQIGQMAGGIGGGLLPFQVDPMMQAYAQQLQQQQMQQLQQLQQPQGQQQIAPQGFFGNLLGQIGQPLGGAIGGIFGQSGLGSQIGGAAGQLGRLLPFQQDPTQAYAQQQAAMSQLAPQGWIGNLIGQYGQPAGSAIGGLFGQSGLGGQIGGIAGQLGRLLPFQQDPISQAYAQLAQQQQQLQQQMQQLQQLQQLQGQQSQQGQQMAPQGFFGNLLGQIGQPLGGAIGGIFGQSGLGSQIGGAAGQLGRLLPFQMDPTQQQAWAQALQQNAPYLAGAQQGYGQQAQGYTQPQAYGSAQTTVH